MAHRAASAPHPDELPERRLRVLVVDDHEVVHWGFRLMLGNEPWVERCLGARNAADAEALTLRYQPQVALVDLFIGEESGADLSLQLRRSSPGTRVLLISGAGRISPAAAKVAGASGFIPKDWSAAEISRAIRMVGLGMTVFHPETDASAGPLSPREREVLELVASGLTNREVALTLHLSPQTVKDLASSVYRKLGAKNRADAVRRAERIGLRS
jgi:DNA-binding NarL/FixJ family response regulator